MTAFPSHTVDTAPEAARKTLQAAQGQLGFIPNLYANLAEAPAALEAYQQLSAAFEKTSLSPAERQVVLLATSVDNGCEFCVAAHSFMAKKMAGVPAPVVEALRSAGTLPDARLNALASFTRSVVRQRGWVKPAEVDAFIAAGFSRAQAIEVVLGVTQKTLSNYVNHLTGTKTNPQFAAEAWPRPS